MTLELPQQDATSVYASDMGYVGIKQADGPGNESLVLIRHDDIPKLIRYLRIARKSAIQFRKDYLANQEAS